MSGNGVTGDAEKEVNPRQPLSALAVSRSTIKER